MRSRREIKKLIGDLLDYTRNRIIDLKKTCLELDERYKDPNTPSLFYIVNEDLLKFSIYLACADGVIEDMEIETINAFLDLHVTRNDAEKLLSLSKNVSVSYFEQVPTSFKVLVTFAKKIGSDYEQVAELYISTFDCLGRLIVAADGNINDNETLKLKSFMYGMHEFLRTI